MAPALLAVHSYMCVKTNGFPPFLLGEEYRLHSKKWQKSSLELYVTCTLMMKKKIGRKRTTSVDRLLKNT